MSVCRLRCITGHAIAGSARCRLRLINSEPELRPHVLPAQERADPTNIGTKRASLFIEGNFSPFSQF